MKVNEQMEREILDKWKDQIRKYGQYHEIEIIIAFRIMLRDGYNTFKDMLESLKIISTYNIYQIEVSSISMHNVFQIDGNYYYIERPKGL